MRSPWAIPNDPRMYEKGAVVMGDATDDAERRAEQDDVIEGEVVEEPSDEVRSAELVIHEERESLPAPQSVLPSPREWEASMAVAREIAGTQFVPESYRGRPDAVLAAILTGREMGIGPMQSLRQIHMIDGRPAFAADLMMAKMRSGGVVVLDSSSNDQRAYIKAKRKDTGEEAEVEWTIADAERAGLLSKRGQAWKNYPSDMLWARAVGRLARRLGSDLLGGLVYAKEEMEDWDESGYGGGGAGYEATTAAPPKPFDPETDLAEGAIHGEDAPRLLAEALNRFDPTVDWGETLGGVTLQMYDVASRRDLEGKELQDYWRRLSNAVWFIDQAAEGKDFPPVPAEQLVAGLAYGFSGTKPEIIYKTVPPPNDLLTPEQQEATRTAASDDVPFGTPSDEP